MTLGYQNGQNCQCHLGLSHKMTKMAGRCSVAG